MEELNEIANTKDEDLEAVLEDGYDHFDEDYTQVKFRDQKVPQPSAGIGAQKNLPKNLDWSDWHRDREEIIQQQLEEREAVVSRRNRSHFNYSFIGTTSKLIPFCEIFSVIFVELVVVLSLTYSRSFYGVSDVHASFIIVNWVSFITSEHPFIFI